MVSFSARISKIGINPVVDPPDPVLEKIFLQAGKSSGPIPVRGKINGAEFIQTLVRYQGAWRLYINGPMLKSSGTKVGDEVKIALEFDPRPRDVPMPEALARALKKDKDAKTGFEKLAPSRQKEILRYIGSLKSDHAIEKNVRKIIDHLRNAPVDQVQ